MSYRLKKKEANWYIYDVFLDNEIIVDGGSKYTRRSSGPKGWKDF